MSASAQFASRIAKAADLKPVYLIAGEEHLLVMEAADALRSRARELGFSEREVHDVESNFDWNDLARSGAAMSLFASQRLIELRLPTGKPGTEGSAAIQEWCERAPSDCVLLITCNQWSKKQEGKWTQAIERCGVFLAVWPLKRDELGAWVQSRAASRSVQLTADAVAALVRRTEGNLLACAQEIDKLALLADGRRVDEAELESLVADSARFDVFGMTEAALSGDGARARRMLASLRAEGEQPAMLMAWLLMQLHAAARLSQLPRAQQAGAFRNEGIWGTRDAAFRKALARGDARFWERRLAEAAAVDRLAKGRGSGDPFVALERLLLRISDVRAGKRMVA
ncbi:MAG: DNA polymerase III subunit delta [Xanthomonadales bacterium]|nr:DNA polymerase III subunit delta [Xanthomonadales bacterium]